MKIRLTVDIPPGLRALIGIQCEKATPATRQDIIDWIREQLARWDTDAVSIAERFAAAQQQAIRDRLSAEKSAEVRLAIDWLRALRWTDERIAAWLAEQAKVFRVPYDRRK